MIAGRRAMPHAAAAIRRQTFGNTPASAASRARFCSGRATAAPKWQAAGLCNPAFLL